MKKIIYYFSGTGNSLRAARLIAAELGGAEVISMRSVPEEVPAGDAEVIGFVCPVYEWDVPKTVKAFIQRLTVNPQAYTFMVATYIAIHGRCFETVDAALREKGTRLHYGRPLRCVASQCTAYEPFPPPKLMVPYSERRCREIGREVASGRERRYPAMSPLTRALYPKMMVLFLEVQREYDKGFMPLTRVLAVRSAAGSARAGISPLPRAVPCGTTPVRGVMPVWPTAPQRRCNFRRRRRTRGWTTRSPGGWGFLRAGRGTTIPM